jgi:hypothetical protein
MRSFLAAAAVLLTACSVQAATPSTTAPLSPPGSTTTTSVAETTTTTTPTAEGWFVISVTAELPEDLSAGLASLAGVDAVSVVRVGNIQVVETRDGAGSIVDQSPEGFVLPLEVHAIDPDAHAAYAPESVVRLLSELGPDQALLSESSARFRRLDTGAELILDDGVVLTVAGVVSDEWVGMGEAVVSTSGAEALGIARERYAILRFDGSRAELELSAGGLTGAPVHVRARDEVDVFRHADSVASQIAIKTMFGEFAYRPTQGDFIEIDPAWLEANIVEVEIPLLGNDKCHRRFVAKLSGVMIELERAGVADAIDPSAYLGCWNSRFIRGRKDLSRHAWGVAADINFGNESDGGPGSPTHLALLDAMLQRDILSGHAWTDPDPGHFEWFGEGP